MLSTIPFPEDFTYVPSSEKSLESKSLEQQEKNILNIKRSHHTDLQKTIQLDDLEDDVKDDYIWKQFSKKLPNLVIKDCIPDGNCQFRSIENALYQYNNKYTHIKLREMVGKYIQKLPESDFINILDNYKIEKDNDEFLGHWDPYKVNTKEDLIKNINTLGFHFEGDDVTLNIISNVLHLDFIMLNSNKSITLKMNNNKIIIVLYYEKSGLSGHYKTIGLKNEKGGIITTAFKAQLLPKEIQYLIELSKIPKKQVIKSKSPKTKSLKTKSPKTKSPKTKSPKAKSPKTKK
jgi:hypothetical protein